MGLGRNWAGFTGTAEELYNRSSGNEKGIEELINRPEASLPLLRPSPPAPIAHLLLLLISHPKLYCILNLYPNTNTDSVVRRILVAGT